MLLPFFNNALAKHPAWHHSVETLREIGVTVLVAPEVYEPHPAGAAVVGFLGNPGSLRRFGMSTETFLRCSPWLRVPR